MRIELYENSDLAADRLRAGLGGARGILRRAAQRLAAAGADLDGKSAAESGDHEAGVFGEFLTETGLWLRPDAIAGIHRNWPMTGGREHRVAFLPAENRVLKDADTRALATETFYEYLTDLVFSNYLFEDDILLIGGYRCGNRLRAVIIQPYIDGTHPDWPELRAGLVRQGLRDPNPRSKTGAFIISDEILGEMDVYDLHVNNVICDAVGWIHPIDAHFYFDDRQSRTEALYRALADRDSSGTV